MNTGDPSERISSSLDPDTRFHTVRSQALAVGQELLATIFLLIGFSFPLIGAILWGILRIPFALVIREQMQRYEPAKAPVVRTLRQVALWIMTGNGVLVILAFGISPLYAIFVLAVYFYSLTLIGEKRGDGRIQLG